MRHTGVDKGGKLVLSLELGIQDIACHIYYLQKLQILIALSVVFNFKLVVNSLALNAALCGNLNFRDASFDFKYGFFKLVGVHLE